MPPSTPDPLSVSSWLHHNGCGPARLLPPSGAAVTPAQGLGQCLGQRKDKHVCPKQTNMQNLPEAPCDSMLSPGEALVSPLRVEPSPLAHPVQTSFPGVSCLPALPTQAPGAAGWGTRRGACPPRGPCPGSGWMCACGLAQGEGLPQPYRPAPSSLPVALGRQRSSLNLCFLFWNMVALRIKRGPEVFQMDTSSAKSRLSAHTHPHQPPSGQCPEPHSSHQPVPPSTPSSPGPAISVSAACGQAGRTLGPAVQRAAAVIAGQWRGHTWAPPKKHQHPASTCPLTGKSRCRAGGLCGQARRQQGSRGEVGRLETREPWLSRLVWELALAPSASRVESGAFPWSRGRGAWGRLGGSRDSESSPNRLILS